MSGVAAVIFDLDGTLIDSDRALRNAFVHFGVAAEDVTFGHVLEEECNRLGIAVEDYLAVYDTGDVAPFEGVNELLTVLPRWAVASHKDRSSGRAELAAMGWSPDVALFAQDFGGPKSLELVLGVLGLSAGDVVFVGDTAHDRLAAHRAGVRFIAAGWNARCDILDGDLVAHRPADIVGLAGLG